MFFLVIISINFKHKTNVRAHCDMVTGKKIDPSLRSIDIKCSPCGAKFKLGIKC